MKPVSDRSLYRTTHDMLEASEDLKSLKTFNSYQRATATTATYPKDLAYAYLGMGLTGEAGEVANLLKKLYRGDYAADEQWYRVREEIADELGDVLWYTSELASHLGYTLDGIAVINETKLARRVENGTLHGHRRNLERIEVSYTNSDDGVWLSCACGWSECLGYGPTAKHVVERSEEHERSHGA